MIIELNGFIGYYADDNGVIYCNLGKGNRNRDSRTELYPLKPRNTPNGYQRVYLRDPATGKRKDYYIHRLVAQAFIPNPDNKRCINHKNCDRSDNSVANLEWATHAENNSYTRKVGHVIRNKSTGRFESAM